MAKGKKKIEESEVAPAQDCKKPEGCEAPKCDCKMSLADRRKARQAKDKVREAAFESVMSDEEFAASQKIQVSKGEKK